MLHTMNIHPVPTEHGKPFNPRNVELDGIVMCAPSVVRRRGALSHLFCFVSRNFDKVPCTLTPRSKIAENLIREAILQ